MIDISDIAKLRSALQSPHPILLHLNADTTWLLQLPYPSSAERPAGRTRFNILLDPWLRGPQSDVAAWFSTQWHVEAPSIQTMDELGHLLAEAEGRDGAAEELESFVDTVAISHEFTDHCHEATLKELPRTTPVFATEKAASLVRSWRHFDTVITTPPFSPSTSLTDWQKTFSRAPLPSWVGIGRVVTAGNALYYHSAVVIVFTQGDDSTPAAVIYSPHGVRGADLAGLTSAGSGNDIRTLALLHGLHDVRIWRTKQLNLGALNALEAVRASGARYWIATHDEVKRGGGFIAPLLRRTRYTVADAVAHETRTQGEKVPGDYEFIELSSGRGLVLS